MYTFAGDTNLSGWIDGDDYFRLDNGFLAHLSGYENGDLDYNGRVDADDYFLIDRNYHRQLYPGSSAPPLAGPSPADVSLSPRTSSSLTVRAEILKGVHSKGKPNAGISSVDSTTARRPGSRQEMERRDGGLQSSETGRCRVLSESEAWAMEAWLRSAQRWSTSAQTMVGAATELTNSSRTLAAQLDAAPVARFSPSPSPHRADDRADLQAQLRLLAETIEDEGRELRDRFLATQADLEVYCDLLGSDRPDGC
jgi:hypothetical protein